MRFRGNVARIHAKVLGKYPRIRINFRQQKPCFVSTPLTTVSVYLGLIASERNADTHLTLSWLIHRYKLFSLLHLWLMQGSQDLPTITATKVPMTPNKSMLRYQRPTRVESGHRGCRVTAIAPITACTERRCLCHIITGSLQFGVWRLRTSSCCMALQLLGDK